MKVIVQCSIISDVPIGEPDQIQGHEEYVLRLPSLSHTLTGMKALSLPHITHGPRWATVDSDQ